MKLARHVGDASLAAVRPEVNVCDLRDEGKPEGDQWWLCARGPREKMSDCALGEDVWCLYRRR